MRRSALSGLASLEDASVLDTLLQFSSRDHNDRQRSAAASALGALADKVESTRPRAVERLIEILGDGGHRSKVAAIGALGAAQDASAIGALGRIHSATDNSPYRRMAYEAMLKIRQGRTSEAGLCVLRDELEELKKETHKLRDRLNQTERLHSSTSPEQPKNG